MIHPTLRQHYRLFWYQDGWKHQAEYVFLRNEAVEVIETTEVVEAVETIEAAEVSDVREITQYVKCMQNPIFEAKEAVEVIEATEVITSVEVLETAEIFRTTQCFEINKLMAEISLFCCFEKKRMVWWNLKWNSAIFQNWGHGGQGYYF